MKKLALILLLALEAFGQTLTGLQTGSGPATGTLANFPLGNFQWSMRFHNLPTTAPASDLILVSVTTYSGLQISCKIQEAHWASPVIRQMGSGRGGASSVERRNRYPAGLHAFIHGDERVPNRRDDGTELFTGTDRFLEGRLFRIPMVQHADRLQRSRTVDHQPGIPARWVDIRDGFLPGGRLPRRRDRGDAHLPGGRAYASCGQHGLPVRGKQHHGCIRSRLYAGGQRAGISRVSNLRPGGDHCNQFDCSAAGCAARAVHADKRLGDIRFGDERKRPVDVLLVAGERAFGDHLQRERVEYNDHSFRDGSYVFQLLVTDGSSHTGTAQLNVGVVNSDANGIKIQTNAELGWIIGSIPRFGTSPGHGSNRLRRQTWMCSRVTGKRFPHQLLCSRAQETTTRFSAAADPFWGQPAIPTM